MMAQYQPQEIFMRQAIAAAAHNLRTLNGGPFGACIVKNDEIIAVAANNVLCGIDATCHAEVNAIRLASQRFQTHDLSGCVIYSTTEPCPMCFSAIHWAKIDRIVYGTDIADVQKLGFNELTISNQQMIEWGQSSVQLTPHFLYEACYQLLTQWKNLPTMPTY
jgi:tRNA(Arg) A34 adenosine deaminase TadA